MDGLLLLAFCDEGVFTEVRYFLDWITNRITKGKKSIPPPPPAKQTKKPRGKGGRSAGGVNSTTKAVSVTTKAASGTTQAESGSEATEAPQPVSAAEEGKGGRAVPTVKVTRAPRTRASRIVGGVESKQHAHPSIISMKFKDQTCCGGTIIREDWVMTAAHCVEESKDAKDYKVVAGAHYINKKEPAQQIGNVVKVVIHEKYDANEVTSDIALFQINPPFKFNANVKAATLPHKGLVVSGGDMLVAGWGLTKEGGRPSNVLKEVALPIIPDNECKKRYPDSIIPPSVICTMAMGGVKDACQGDSGGPLYLINRTHSVVAGVVSWGEGCAVEGKPGVFTEVKYYLDWIDKQMKQNTKSIPSKPVKPVVKPVKPVKGKGGGGSERIKIRDEGSLDNFPNIPQGHQNYP